MSIKSAFEQQVHCSRGVLRVCEDLFPLDSFSRILVIAFGRSAHEMAELLSSQVGTYASGIISAPLVAGKPQLPGFRYFQGRHPLPDGESQRAADSILRTLSALDKQALVIYLISAGSSFVESPQDREVSIEDMAETYNVLAESPLSSDEAKAILKHLSANKGGRMALAAAKHDARQVSILLADTANSALDSLAGGPTVPDGSSVEDCYQIASHYGLVERLPASLRELFEKRALDETPDKDHPAFHHCRWWPIIYSKEHE